MFSLFQDVLGGRETKERKENGLRSPLPLPTFTARTGGGDIGRQGDTGSAPPRCELTEALRECMSTDKAIFGGIGLFGEFLNHSLESKPFITIEMSSYLVPYLWVHCLQSRNVPHALVVRLLATATSFTAALSVLHIFISSGSVFQCISKK